MNLQELLEAYRTAAANKREKGDYFEKLVRVFLEHDDTQRQFYCKVMRYADWAAEQGWSGADTGIDLVAELADGSGYTAVQCRFLPLALVKVAQLQGRHDDSMAHIERLMETDPVVLLSFAELALDTPDDRPLMDRVVRTMVHVENGSPVDAAILLYRRCALAALGMPDAAIDLFTLANRRRKDRPRGLLHQIRYDRAVLYHETGQRGCARRQLERLYTADPGFEDVAERVGVGG